LPSCIWSVLRTCIDFGECPPSMQNRRRSSLCRNL
jgi:hypothetical protein